jgi:sporulation protein YlmC with PRC-barrel domain
MVMPASDAMRETGMMGTFSVKDVMGKRVQNPQGENLGNIEDIVIDSDAGRIAYAVLSFGGFLGLGDKLFAIPWQALSLEAQRGTLVADQVFILNVDKDRLKNAPGFERDNSPNMADRSFGAGIYDYYGYKPYW